MGGITKHFPHLEHVDAKELALPRQRGLPQAKQQQLKLVVAGQTGALFNFRLRGLHGTFRVNAPSEPCVGSIRFEVAGAVAHWHSMRG